MGELITDRTSTTLCYAPEPAFSTVRAAELPRPLRARLFACLARLNTLYMIARAGSGHIGSSFSSLDLVTWLHLFELGETEDAPVENLYFSSKGHDVPGLYATLIGCGRLPFESLHRLRQFDGLPGHPDVGTKGVLTNTGSLGMGISKAKGMLFARRHRGREGRLYVLTGDGELQEGQIWESLISAANQRLKDLTVLVDHNKLQSDTYVEATNHLGDLVAKFEAFGWHTQRIDGHDFEHIDAALNRAKRVTDRPQVIIADTVKGRGVPFMEEVPQDTTPPLYRFHSGAPDPASYTQAVSELTNQLEVLCREACLDMLPLERVQLEHRPKPEVRTENLIAAYSRALVRQLEKTPHAVVLDCDLMVDTGQLPARQRFAERYVECGIAEMDMVSQAGGMALEGLLPICHSFAAFLSSRPNEQIYNNATEHTKIIYVGSLAGLLPAGPGHSHQAVRDISALAAVPGLLLIEPSCEEEVEAALEFALHGTDQSVYLRLTSVPYAYPGQAPKPATLQEGRGTVIREGEDALLFGYGPILLAESLRAALALELEGISVGVVNLPFLNRVDDAWLRETVGSHTRVLCLDNHYLTGGQGDLLCSRLAQLDLPQRVRPLRHGLSEIPRSGTNDRVLAHHGLDAASLAARVRALAG